MSLVRQDDECYPDCVEAFRFYRIAKERYEFFWPFYCRNCSGVGEFGFYENHAPLGSGQSWLEYMADPCPECTEQNVCARCGDAGLGADGEGPCRWCGWNYNDSLPAEPECWCWLRKEGPADGFD